jgi:predicted transcriptional regulator
MLDAITITLAAQELTQLRELAQRLNISTEDLARRSIQDFLARPEEVFDEAVTHVLEKNSELYRRLAA